MSFCLRSWLTGFALGLSGKPYPYSKREPTAYLYNGIRLPALPEWDREKYPYAAITIYSSYTSLLATVYPARKYDGYHYGRWFNGEGQQLECDGIVFRCSDGLTWSEGEERSDYNATGTVFSDEIRAVWSSYDVIYDITGEVLLAASEPIPIYE